MVVVCVVVFPQASVTAGLAPEPEVLLRLLDRLEDIVQFTPFV
jgi:hypothetical protein